MIEFVIRYKRKMTDDINKLSWFDDAEDYLYFSLNVEEIGKMFTTAESISKYQRDLDEALVNKDYEYLYKVIKDIVLCSFIECSDKHLDEPGSKNAVRTMLFSRSESFYRFMDILILDETTMQSFIFGVFTGIGTDEVQSIKRSGAIDNYESRKFEAEHLNRKD